MKREFLFKAIALMACLMCSIGAVAQEAYTVFTEADSTLTFFYDGQRNTRPGTSYSLNNGDTLPEWFVNRGNVYRVRFDSTFVAARPTSAYGWFYDMARLNTIAGIKNLNTSMVTNMRNMFTRCESLKLLDVSGFSTEKVTTMVEMFNGCSSLKSLDVSNFKTANVTDMGAMFANCDSLATINVRGFNTANVTDMDGMFSGCKSLTSIDLGSFNTGKVTNMSFMFRGCSALDSLDVSHFKTSNVTDMEAMFTGCSSLDTLDLSNFNTPRVTNMSYMFRGCSALDSINLKGFITSEVTDMGSMFEGCSSLASLDLSRFDAEKVRKMESMFKDCNSLTSLDLSGFVTNSAVDMVEMFAGCTSLAELDLTNFNTSGVGGMKNMFKDCQSLTTLNLVAFNTVNVTDMDSMFYGCNHLKTIYAGRGWTTASVIRSGNMFSGCFSLEGERGTTYDGNHVDIAYARFDEGASQPGYLSRKREAYTALATDRRKLAFYYDDERSLRPGNRYLLTTEASTSPGWYDDVRNVTVVTFDSTFVDARPTTTNSWFRNMNKLDSIAGITYLNTSLVTDMRRMFAGCSSLKSLDLSGFNTENVTNMWAMFSDCGALTSLDVSSFKTSNVTNMARMFSGCSSLKSLGLSSFKTDSVQDMTGMFADCRSLASLDLRSFEPDSVRYIGWMFSGCSALSSLDLRNFKTDSVAEMEYMFEDCKALRNINLSSFNTECVKDMEGMFAGCESLTALNLRSFNTENVRNMVSMFNGCKKLYTICVEDEWSTSAVTKSDNMFYGCTSLVGGQGTSYDQNHVDAAYAHIDGGPSDPGYLSGKTNILLRGDVNADGEVNIADVNCINDVILGAPDTYEGRADVNGDGEVNIADINALIDIILGDTAPSQDHEFVDLGLPSGTLWATCNVGADTPEGYGDYFAWGETAPKEVYNTVTYKWCKGSWETMTKYCTESYYGYNGFVDNKTELDPEDDAAYVNWGPSWCMPSTVQLQELFAQCTWTWTTRNGVNGHLVTGPNGNTIFLPASGLRGGSSQYDLGSSGNYWSRTLVSEEPYGAVVSCFDSRYVDPYGCGPREKGFTVRAVRISQN